MGGKFAFIFSFNTIYENWYSMSNTFFGKFMISSPNMYVILVPHVMTMYSIIRI